MARIQNPIIGRARKHAGGMIFYKLWKHNIMRAMPVDIRVNNSTLRLIQRSKFASVKAFASPIISCIRFSFLCNQITHSAFSAFMRANLPTCLVAPYNEWPTLDTVSDGQVNFGGASLPDLQNLVCVALSGMKVSITWDPDLIPPGLPTDNIAVLIYKQAAGGVAFKSWFVRKAEDALFAVMTRADGGAVCHLPLPFLPSDIVNVVCFVYNDAKYHAGTEFISKFSSIQSVTLVV